MGIAATFPESPSEDVMKNRLEGKTVVITGASSGIGRATAERLAECGAKIVLAARDKTALREVAELCAAKGTSAIAVPTDVTDLAAVKHLVDEALARFGHIDIWFNNAGVGAFGCVEEVPPDVYRHVIETNLFGYIHCAQSVMPFFKRQGFGTLINNASLVGKTSVPYASAYVASKHAIVGWSQSLREELHDYPNIHVCTLLPAAIDTPFFQHAANYTGREAIAPKPVHSVDEVVSKVCKLMVRPKPEVAVGGAPKMRSIVHCLFPRMMELANRRYAEREHFSHESTPLTEGSVISHSTALKTSGGGWLRPEVVRQRRRNKTAAAFAASAGLGYLAWNRWRSKAS
jgi:short-subunit dehydrogenase